jgi:hypothetical protein
VSGQTRCQVIGERLLMGLRTRLTGVAER